MTQVSWQVRLITAEGTGIGKHALQLELFDLVAGWKAIASATSGADGTVRAKAEDGVAKAIVAPMLRLVDSGSGAVLGGLPQLTAAGAPPILTANFGDVAPPRDTASLTTKPGAATLAKSVPASTPTDEPLRIAEARLAERDLDLARIKAERDDLAARLVDSEARLATSRDAATATAAALREKDLPETNGSSTTTSTATAASAAAVSLGDFATRLGGEIDSAQVALKARGFSVGTVSINAKTMVGAGSALVFPDAEQLKSVPADALSDVAIVFNPSPTAEANGGVQVPDLRQLTESAARRVLGSVGLTLEASQGPGAIDPNCAPGQAMLQAPAAGASAPRGSAVLVIFAGTAAP